MNILTFVIVEDIKAVRAPSRGRRRPKTPNPEVRRRLLEAGMALIQEQGFPSLRVEELAERAGLSVGTFYLYFDGKSDFFVNLVMDYTRLLRERLNDAYKVDGTIAERLVRRLNAYLDFVSEYEPGFLYFRDAGAIETTVGRLSTWALNQHAADFEAIIREGMAKGEIRKADPELVAQAIVAMNQHIVGYWLEHKGTYTREQVTRFLIGYAAAALAP